MINIINIINAIRIVRYIIIVNFYRILKKIE